MRYLLASFGLILPIAAAILAPVPPAPHEQTGGTNGDDSETAIGSYFDQSQLPPPIAPEPTEPPPPDPLAALRSVEVLGIVRSEIEAQALIRENLRSWQVEVGSAIRGFLLVSIEDERLVLQKGELEAELTLSPGSVRIIATRQTNDR